MEIMMQHIEREELESDRRRLAKEILRQESMKSKSFLEEIKQSDNDMFDEKLNQFLDMEELQFGSEYLILEKFARFYKK